MGHCLFSHDFGVGLVLLCIFLRRRAKKPFGEVTAPDETDDRIKLEGFKFEKVLKTGIPKINSYVWIFRKSRYVFLRIDSLKEGFVLRMMRVAWLSGRVLGDDLCGTTQFSLSNGMVEMGWDVILYSPGRMTTANFKHIRIDRGSVKGLHSWRIVRALHNHIESINSADHVLVDWRLHAITPLLTGNWTLVDRGPPADQGVLSLFQHQQWKRGWKKARQGTAVSTAHANYIHHETGMDIENISVIPAGVDVARFTPGIKKGVLKMAYQGQIDAHRGVLMLPKILIHLQEKGIEVSLHFHGDGDAAEKNKEHGNFWFGNYFTS